jgi:hypothetical protein
MTMERPAIPVGPVHHGGDAEFAGGGWHLCSKRWHMPAAAASSRLRKRGSGAGRVGKRRLPGAHVPIGVPAAAAVASAVTPTFIQSEPRPAG